MVLVELLYPGYSDPAGKKEKYDYWTAQGSGYVFLLPADICKKVFIKDTSSDHDAPVSSVLYMIRHGQGEHNLSGLRNKLIWDPLLVSEKGIEGATKSIWTDLKEMQKTSNPEIKLGFFSSPLQRCIETLCLFLVSWKELSSTSSTPQKIQIQILPCIHELRASIKKGHLDGSCDQPFNTLTAVPSWWKVWEYGNFENTSKCLRKPVDCTYPNKFLTPELYNHKSQAVKDVLSKLKQQIGLDIQIIWKPLTQNKTSCINTLFTQFIKPEMFTFPLTKTDADPNLTFI